MVSHHNGECTQTHRLPQVWIFQGPQIPMTVPYMQENSRLRHTDEWGRTRQHKINRSLEISLQSKKDPKSKSQKASLAPSVIVTFHENSKQSISKQILSTHTFTVAINHLSFLFCTKDISVVNPSHTNAHCANSQLHNDSLASSTNSSFQKNKDRKGNMKAPKSNKNIIYCLTCFKCSQHIRFQIFLWRLSS